MNGYELSRKWHDWIFENPEKVKPFHSALYFWLIELCNRLGWKEKFRVPTLNAMEVTGIRSKNTYYRSFNDLIDWGFIELIEKAKNQNSANIISLSGASRHNPAGKPALDSAIMQQLNQPVNNGGNIDKPLNNKPLNQKPLNNSLLSEINISDLEDDQKEYFKIAIALQKLFIKNLKEKDLPTKKQEKAKFKDYVNPVRLMMTKDGVTKEHLQKVFKYLDSPDGEFWVEIIRDTSKLRKHFEQLILKATKNKKTEFEINRQGISSVVNNSKGW